MTLESVLRVAEFVITIAIAIALYAWRGGEWKGDERRHLKGVSDQFEEFKTETLRRFEQASKHTSDAWTYVQALESKIMHQCASKEMTDERFRQNRADHERYERDLDQLRSRFTSHE